MLSEWPKIIVPIVVALLGAWGIAYQQSSGSPSQTDFSRAAISNCEGINDLKGTLRELILSVPPDRDNPRGTEDFTERALELLQPVNCQELVNT